MNLEWKMKVVFALMRQGGFESWGTLGVAEARKMNAQPRNPVTDLFFGKPIELPFVADISIPGRDGSIPARVYRPKTNQSLPMLVYFHGGGWTIGSIDGHDVVCRRLAHESGRLVVSVGYRQAPEHKFPTAVYDAFDAVSWVAEHGARFGGMPDNLAIGGDSAGGNLAAIVSQMARDANRPAISKQLLIYPVTDISRQYASEDQYADAPMLSREDLHWFYSQYVNDDADRFDVRFSPLLGRLHDLPNALIIAAEYDPIRDQGRIYYEALRAYGNVADYRLYPRQPHGFLSMAGLSSQTDSAYADMAYFLRN